MNLNVLWITALGLAVATSSCQKEKKEAFFKADVQTEYSTNPNCPGGGDDEDPILMGIAKDDNNGPIEDATAKLFDATSTQPFSTDITTEDGEFCFNVASGDYFVISSAPGFDNDTTDVFNLNKDTSIVVILR